MIRIEIDNIDRCRLDWLVGLFFADGSKYAEKGYRYRVNFYLCPVVDDDILKRTASILKDIGLNPHTFFKSTINTMDVRVTSKEFFNFLPDKTKFQNFFPKNKESFISGFLDGDGFVSKKEGCVGFSQTTVKWIGPYISDYFKSCGIMPWKETYYRGAFYYKTSFKKIKEKTNITKYMIKAGAD